MCQNRNDSGTLWHICGTIAVAGYGCTKWYLRHWLHVWCRWTGAYCYLAFNEQTIAGFTSVFYNPSSWSQRKLSYQRLIRPFTLTPHKTIFFFPCIVLSRLAILRSDMVSGQPRCSITTHFSGFRILSQQVTGVSSDTMLAWLESTPNANILLLWSLSPPLCK